MERKEVLNYVMDPNYVQDFQWKGEHGHVQFFESLRTGNLLTIDADTLTYYDGRMREIHAVDAQAAVGIHIPNPGVTERINADVHEGREDVFAQSANGAALRYEGLDYESRGGYGIDYIYLEQHRYTGGLVRHDLDGQFFDNQLHPISQHDALAGVVNYGAAGGTLEKLPPVDLETLHTRAERTTPMSAAEYQALRAENGPEWRHSVRVETAPPHLEGHYVGDPNLPERLQERIDAYGLRVYEQQYRFYSPQLYDSMLAMNGPDWPHRVIVGPEELYTLPLRAAENQWQRTAPEQDSATALSVEAAYPRNHIAPTYEQALERWEAAVHLHEDLRGRPLTPQEYQQQLEMNGPLWEHRVVLAQPVDGALNIHDRLYTQITPGDQTLLPDTYERLLQVHGADWQYSVLVMEPFPQDPDARFQAAHREWLEVNEGYLQQRGVPISPQEYQAHRERQGWHGDSDVIVLPPLAPGLQEDARLTRYDLERGREEHLSHDEYQALLRANGPEWRHSVIVDEPQPPHFGMELPTSWRPEGMHLEHVSAHPEQQVVPYAKSDWTVEPDGLWEHRVHFGKSGDGFHYATEFSYRGGDSGGSELAWSGPYASHNEANSAAQHQIAQTLATDTGYGMSL